MRYEFDKHLAPILQGEVTVPNFEAVADLPDFLNTIAACGHSMMAKWGWARLPGADRKQWAMFFLSPSAMGNANSGAFDGSGYVIAYASRTPVVGTFAICRHEKRDGAGADHRRGWHPGSCVKCGLDMTVDSGD